MKAIFSMDDMAGWNLTLTPENEVEQMMLEAANRGVGVKVESYSSEIETGITSLIIIGEGKRYVRTHKADKGEVQP